MNGSSTDWRATDTTFCEAQTLTDHCQVLCRQSTPLFRTKSKARTGSRQRYPDCTDASSLQIANAECSLPCEQFAKIPPPNCAFSLFCRLSFGQQAHLFSIFRADFHGSSARLPALSACSHSICICQQSAVAAPLFSFLLSRSTFEL